ISWRSSMAEQRFCKPQVGGSIPLASSIVRSDRRKRPETGRPPLVCQFISHRVQQLRHAKGLLKGPPCSEEFRDIQDICFPASACDRDHLRVEELTRQC